MKFSYNWLQSFFKKKLPQPERLAEILTFHSFEVEGIEKIDNDYVFNIDVLPNRASDCLSHIGIAREIGVLVGQEVFPTSFQIKEDKTLKIKDFISLSVSSHNDCLRYMAKAITNVKVGPSPQWLREKIEACGVKSINSIVDVVNYVMLDTGQPLHAFDGSKISGGKVIVRRAKKGETIITLDDEKYELDKKVLVIADSEKPIAIAGIKGGKYSGISNSTSFVVVEAANFSPKTIKMASQMIDLKTDASLRFEHGLDLDLSELALNKAIYLIQEINGGKVLSGVIDFYPKKQIQRVVRLDVDYIDKVLGIKVPKKDILRILDSLKFQVKINKNNKLVANVPTFRLDIINPEDIIEEIGRIYGYRRIQGKMPLISLFPPNHNLKLMVENSVKDVLVGAGFTEVYNYSFVSERDNNFLKGTEAVEIQNPISQDFKYLRPTLLVNLLKNISRNKREFPDIRIFEIGRIFFDQDNNFKVLERNMLAGVATGDVFYSVKGVLELLFEKIGMAQKWFYERYDSEKEVLWNLNRTAVVVTEKDKLGVIGEISDQALREFKIEGQVIAFEIDFEKLMSICSEDYEYKPISKYPAAIRDLAILTPFDVKVGDVLNLVKEMGGRLVRDVNIFDIYEGKELPQGKKNLAFRIVYQAQDHTLSSAEIEKLQHKIIKSLEKKSGWEVRK